MPGIRCGIVGLPNVGKSTLFNAVTNAGIAAENYPFCTIDPNVGIAFVPDPRLDAIAEISQPAEIVPTTVEFVDIAGLVRGASQGEGLGNKFLAHIREVDAVAQVVRCFDDPDVVHVAGAVDPISDIEIITTELALADLATVEKALDRVGRQARAGDKTAQPMSELLHRVKATLEEGRPARATSLTDDERRSLRELFLLTMKPTMYVANVAEDAIHGEDPLVEKVKAHAAAEGSDVVVISAEIEAEIASLPPTDRAAFLADLEIEESGLDQVIHAAYHLLDLQTFFTTGPKQSRAWTVRRGARAPEAAGRIHTDFERGFIRAEVASWKDFVELGGEQGAKDAGKWRLEGRDYVVCEGDLIYFRFNV